MPPSEFPLTGYTVARDQAYRLRGWLRLFEARSGDYWYLDFRVTVLDPSMSARTAIAQEKCDWTFSGPGTTTAKEVSADVIGDGAKACLYTFSEGNSEWVAYITGTRNVEVMVGGSARSVALTRTDTINRMISLARQQIDIINRVAPAR